MRAIIGASLRFRVLVVAVAAGGPRPRRHAAARRAGRRPARVHAARTSRSRPRRSGCRPRRSSSSSRSRSRPTCSTATAGVSVLRSESVPGVSSIVLLFEPGTDIMRRAPARAGAAHPGARHPERLQAAADDPAALVAEPGHDDRALAREADADRDLGARPLDDPPAPAWASPASPTCRSSGLRDRQLQVLVDPQRLRDQRVTLSQVIRDGGQRPARLAAQLPRGLDAGHRRVHRHAQPAPAGPPHPPDRRRRASSRRSRSRAAERAGEPLRLGDVEHRRRGPPAAHRRRGRQRRARAACSSSRSSRAPTRSR